MWKFGVVEIYTCVSNKDVVDRKPLLDVACLEKKRCEEMRRREIMEICGMFNGVCAQY